VEATVEVKLSPLSMIKLQLVLGLEVCAFSLMTIALALHVGDRSLTTMRAI